MLFASQTELDFFTKKLYVLKQIKKQNSSLEKFDSKKLKKEQRNQIEQMKETLLNLKTSLKEKVSDLEQARKNQKIIERSIKLIQNLLKTPSLENKEIAKLKHKIFIIRELNELEKSLILFKSEKFHNHNKRDLEKKIKILQQEFKLKKQDLEEDENSPIITYREAHNYKIYLDKQQKKINRLRRRANNSSGFLRKDSWRRKGRNKYSQDDPYMVITVQSLEGERKEREREKERILQKSKEAKEKRDREEKRKKREEHIRKKTKKIIVALDLDYCEDLDFLEEEFVLKEYDYSCYDLQRIFNFYAETLDTNLFIEFQNFSLTTKEKEIIFQLSKQACAKIKCQGEDLLEKLKQEAQEEEERLRAQEDAEEKFRAQEDEAEKELRLQENERDHVLVSKDLYSLKKIEVQKKAAQKKRNQGKVFHKFKLSKGKKKRIIGIIGARPL